jgi:hypothetical protein
MLTRERTLNFLNRPKSWRQKMASKYPASMYIVLAISASLFIAGFLLMMMSSDPIAAALPAGAMVVLALGTIAWGFIRNRNALREYFAQMFTSEVRR